MIKYLQVNTVDVGKVTIAECGDKGVCIDWGDVSEGEGAGEGCLGGALRLIPRDPYTKAPRPRLLADQPLPNKLSINL